MSVLGVVLFVGCGPNDIAQVTGKVTLDGEPLGGVEIRFTPTEGEKKTSSRAVTEADGTYTLKYTAEVEGALIGNHLVQVVNSIDNKEEGKELDKEAEAFRNKLPEKYYKNSDLSAEVKKGENVFNFDLESK